MKLIPVLIMTFILLSGCAGSRGLTAQGNARADNGRVRAAFDNWLKLMDENPDEAQKAYAELSELAPEAGWVRYDGAIMHLKLNALKRAEAELIAALKRGASPARALPARVYNALGAVYLADGKNAEAYQAFKKAYGAGILPAAIINLANTEQIMGQSEAALKHYREAEILDGANQLLHYNMGIVFYRMGNYNQAQEEFAKALALGKKDVRISLCQAQTLFKLGEYEKGLDIIREIPGNDLTRPYLYKNTGIVHEIYLGDMDKASEAYSVYISITKDKEAEAWLDTIKSRAMKQDR